MDIAALKQQARTLEQAGSVDEALEVYRQVLAELEAIGGIRQELPLLIKIGDLLAKSDDVDGAVEMYERAAGEYAQQGAAQPVISLCVKILRADPQETGAYLRLARLLLDAGHTDGARLVLIDYAQRGNLDRTREGLEALRGRPDEEIKRLLDKAIFTAERRLAKRAPRPPRRPRPPRFRRPHRAAPPIPPPEDLPEEEPPEEEPPEEPDGEPESEDELPGPPRQRITVPVGAMDAEPDVVPPPPPEPKPEEAFPTAEELAGQAPRQPLESRPQDAFPSAEDLQAPVLPPLEPTPPMPPPAPPPQEMEPPAPPLGIERGPPSPVEIDTNLAPAPRDSQPGFQQPPLPPEQEGWSPEHAGAHHEAPPPPRVSRPQPRPARPARRRRSVATRAPRRTPRRRGWLWFLLLLVVGGGGVLVWRGIVPLHRLRNLFGTTEAAESTQAPARARTRPRGDSVMARDTAGFRRPRPARPAPATPSVPTLVLPQMPVVLPAGVTLARSVYVVRGLHVESVTPDSTAGGMGYTIVQILPSGQRIILDELPTDTVAPGEIGVTGIDPDTSVGHTGIGGLVVTLKGVIPDDVVVQLLQELIEIRP